MKMKIKNALRFQLQDYLKPSAIYYGIIYCLFAAMLVIKHFAGIRNVGTSGMDMATFIFLFVIGLNSFKTQFRLFLQNGLSRRTLFVGFLLSAACLSLVTAVIDSTHPLLFAGSLGYSSMYGDMYGAAGGISITGVVWNAAANLLALCFGFFITTLYYRMSKPLKVLVSVGVPLLIFVVMPIVEVFVPSFHLFSTLIRWVTWLLGFSGTGGAGPLAWRAVASLLGGSAILSGLAYILIHRVTLKETA